MDCIVELPNRNGPLLLSTLVSLVNNLDGDAKRNEMKNYHTSTKHEQVMTHILVVIFFAFARGKEIILTVLMDLSPVHQIN